MSNGCSTIGISKTPPIELLEQRFPVLFEEFALAEGTGGPGRRRGGFGVRYKIALRRGEARASFVMDHGRVGPPGIFGGAPGLPNHIEIEIAGCKSIPVHLSKDQDITLKQGDSITVRTPGGGGFGEPAERERELLSRDLRRGYYTAQQIAESFGIEMGKPNA